MQRIISIADMKIGDIVYFDTKEYSIYNFGLIIDVIKDELNKPRQYIHIEWNRPMDNPPFKLNNSNMNYTNSFFVFRKDSINTTIERLQFYTELFGSNE